MPVSARTRYAPFGPCYLIGRLRESLGAEEFARPFS